MRVKCAKGDVQVDFYPSTEHSFIHRINVEESGAVSAF